ncbi:MAG: hydroxymethylglutaryl-CoA reductase [Bacteriovoracaceae bacterium]
MAVEITGFSRLSKDEKIKFLDNEHKERYGFSIESTLKSFWHGDEKQQQVIDEFSENTISNFVLPFGIVPNVMINDHVYNVPMAIEESSVVAACSKSAKFWLARGGIKAEVVSTKKVGHVHFSYSGSSEKLFQFFEQKKSDLLKMISPLTKSMEKRGGGVLDIHLKDQTKKLENYYQIEAEFETCDAMGANFINSVLESLAENFKMIVVSDLMNFDSNQSLDFEIIMAILSNYTPECIAKVEVSCPVEDLEIKKLGISGKEFAEKFLRAIQIARADVSRAVTHNKGIFNGIDAVVLSTGNDFRAVEACGHAYASRDGSYRGLTLCEIEDGLFKFRLEMPLAIGTVGGLTNLHPLSRLALDLLEKPKAEDLMKVILSVGLLQNFAAVSSLITTGIQKGHMKMHLLNILRHLEASEREVELTKDYFDEKVVSFSSVKEFVSRLRDNQ